MPNFILIDPTTKSIQNYDAPDYRDALRAVGLESGSVDFGHVGQTPNQSWEIIVYEYSLISPKTDKYFILNYQLFNGPAVLYCSDAEGETIDCHPEMAEHIRTTHITWLDSLDEAELAIQNNKAYRPQSKVNGQVVWSWNQPH